MKKKNLIFSIIIGIMVVTFVSAALVGYLSNKVTADIKVESPMLVGISKGYGTWGGDDYPQDDHTLDDWETGCPMFSIHGGETITLYTFSENLADVEISGFEEANVTNSLGVTCDDFESVMVRVDSIYGELGYGSPTDVINDYDGALCRALDANTIQLGSSGDSTWGVGETDVSEITVTFKTDAKGIYVFAYQVIPAV